MKKIFALLIAMTMALLMLMPAFAEDSHSVKSDDVWIEVDATAKYLIGDRTDFTVDDAVDLYYLAQNFPEAITEEILENFKNNVKQNLADNSNKLVPSFGENMTTYAAVVWLLDSNCRFLLFKSLLINPHLYEKEARSYSAHFIPKSKANSSTTSSLNAPSPLSLK